MEAAKVRARHLEAGPPEILYHYTRGEMLLRMVTERSLFATHLNYMNDASELTYASKLVEHLLEITRSITTDEVELELLAKAPQYINPFAGEIYHAAAFCLSTKKDSLGQWRAYADNGRGYCIGFDAKELRELPGHFVRVVYDPKEQETELLRLFNAWLAALHGVKHLWNSVESQEEAQTVALHSLRSILAPYLFSCKSPVFAEEAEWRLVFLIAGKGVMSFRTKDGHIIPYIRYGNMGFRLPIREVIFGPGVSDLDKAAAKHLLQSHDFTPRWSSSLIPLRS